MQSGGDRLRAVGATVTDGPRLNGVQWLRIRRNAGVHYLAAGDTVGLAWLADAMERGALPDEPPEPEKAHGKPVKDTNPGQMVAEAARSKPKKKD